MRRCLSQWLRNALFEAVVKHSRVPGGRHRRSQVLLLRFEVLEARILPASITVDTLNDVVDANDSVTSLREAIATAAANPGADVIVLPEGHYTLDLGQLTIDDASGSLTIQADGGLAIIDAQGASRVFEILAGSNVVLQGVGITGGFSISGGGIENRGVLEVIDGEIFENRATIQGGGLTNLGGTATIAGTTVRDNTADIFFGGLFNNGTMTITDAAITENTAVLAGGINNSGALTLQDSLVSGNTATGAFGGGISIGPLATMTLIVDTAIVGNAAPLGRGGGVDNEGVLTLVGGLIAGNTARDGGGLHVGLDATLDVTGTAIDGNTATRDGGGLYIVNQGTTTLSGATITNNTAEDGGGFYLFLGTLEVEASTIADNTATGDGGGFYNVLGTLELLASTVSGNMAGTSGGGIFNDENGTVNVTSGTLTENMAGVAGGGFFNVGSALLGSTIIAGNHAISFAPDVAGDFASVGYNLVGNGDESTGFGSMGDLVGTTVTPIDPRLGPLQDNGGPTFTHALLAGSPALNAGDPGLAGTTDQRGVLRPQGGGVDIGAFELVTQDIVIDIRPGSDVNPVNLKAKGVLPVAILSTDDFDAMLVDVSDLSLIQFGDVSSSIRVSPVGFAWEDTNGDGLLDLLLFFSIKEIASVGALVATSVQAELTSYTTGGIALVGVDTVWIVPPTPPGKPAANRNLHNASFPTNIDRDVAFSPGNARAATSVAVDLPDVDSVFSDFPIQLLDEVNETQRGAKVSPPRRPAALSSTFGELLPALIAQLRL